MVRRENSTPEDAYFVEWHTVGDLQAFKIAEGVEGKGSLKQPCPLCLCTRDDMEKNLDKPESWFEEAGRVRVKRGVYLISRFRMHPCVMHCEHRVTEKILQQLMRIVNDQTPKRADFPSQRYFDAAMLEFTRFRDGFLMALNSNAADKLELERYGCKFEIQGMYLKAGNARFEYEFGNASKPKKVPLNGPECGRFINGAEQLLQYVCALPGEREMPVSEVLARSVHLWADVVSYLHKDWWRGDEKEKAMAAGRD